MVRISVLKIEETGAIEGKISMSAILKKGVIFGQKIVKFRQHVTYLLAHTVFFFFVFFYR